MALSAIGSFFTFTLKRPPNLRVIKCGQQNESPAIQELTAEEMQRFWTAVDVMPLTQRVALRILIESGHRRRSIMLLPRTAFQVDKDGGVLVFPSKDQKRGCTSVVPLSKETCELLQKHLQTHEDKIMFPLGISQPERWLYRMVKQTAQDAGITTRTYPHLFRHSRALKFRRMGAPEDTVINSMGWKDGTMYNSRYGRRNAFETAREARKYLPKPEELSKPKPDTISETINKLVNLLNEDKIDMPTYQASLAALRVQQKEPIETPEYIK